MTATIKAIDKPYASPRGNPVEIVVAGETTSEGTHVRIASSPFIYDAEQAFELIGVLAKEVGLKLDRTGADGWIIQKPVSKAFLERRADLAEHYTGDVYENATTDAKLLIDALAEAQLRAEELEAKQ